MSRTFEEYIETGEVLDNRKAERRVVPRDLFHPEYGTVTCPHCGCTLGASHVMNNGYCYVCGGGFSEVIRPE